MTSLDRPGDRARPLFGVALCALAAWSAMVALGALARAAGGRAGAGEVVASLLATALLVALASRRAPWEGARPSEHEASGRTLTAARERAILVGLAVVIVLLACARIDSFPGLRADEALFLQYPANWARHGRFALRLGERFDPALSAAGTGPAVLFPAALLFRAFGPSLVLARAVSAAYLLATAIAMCWAARRAFGRGAGLAALLGLAAFPETILTGRMMMGDFAASGLLIAGSLLWLESLERAGRAATVCLAASGLAFGLMALAKLSFIVAGAGFLGFALHDRGRERRLRLVHLVVPALGVLALALPWEVWCAVHDHAQLLYAASSGAGSVYATLDLDGFLDKARETCTRPELPLGLAGLALALGRGGRGARAAALWGTLALAWLLWFLTFRTVLHRYLIVPSLLAILLASPLAAEAAEALNTRSPDPRLRAFALALATLAIAYPALRTGNHLAAVLGHPEAETQDARVARRLRAVLVPGEVLNCSHTPFRILFFDDRPFREMSLAETAELAPGSYYLWSSPWAMLDPGPALAEVWRDEPYVLLRRR